ncbi:MAG: hypothetical protein LUO96_00380 [Methanomicrobiales archaeon]|nr:hypothetical protein [Methanomicrobiales archaeon]
MDTFAHRTWVPFYLASFGTISIGFFRALDGVMLLSSLLLVGAALAIIFITIQGEVERCNRQKELMETLSQKAKAAGEGRQSDAK